MSPRFHLSGKYAFDFYQFGHVDLPIIDKGNDFTLVFYLIILL